MAKEIEPTAEDWEAVRRSLENPRQRFMETLVRMEARRRLERERTEQRRRLLKRLSLGLLGRY